MWNKELGERRSMADARQTPTVVLGTNSLVECWKELFGGGAGPSDLEAEANLGLASFFWHALYEVLSRNAKDKTLGSRDGTNSRSQSNKDKSMRWGRELGNNKPKLGCTLRQPRQRSDIAARASKVSLLAYFSPYGLAAG